MCILDGFMGWLWLVGTWGGGGGKSTLAGANLTRSPPRAVLFTLRTAYAITQSARGN